MTIEPGISIRRAERGDLPALAGLRWEMRVEDGKEEPAFEKDEFVARFSDWLGERHADRRVIHLLAEEGANLLGTIALIPIEMLPRPCRFEDRMGYVTDFFVRSSARGNGIGGKLLEAARQLGLEMDLELLITWPSENAARLYERHGFRGQNDVSQLTLREY